MFENYRVKSIACFIYLFKLLKDSVNKDYVDRLGRTILHQIFQYDLYECLSDKEVLSNIELLFMKDFNGETVVEYIYTYNAKECFKVLLYNYFDAQVLYKEIKSKGINFFQKCVLL